MHMHGNGRDESARVIRQIKARLGFQLRARRHHLGKSQAAVALALGTSQSRLAKLEAGELSVSLDLLVRSLLGLGVTAADIGRIMTRIH